MNFFRAMNSSRPVIEFGSGVWAGLMADLKVRGRGTRESGAFLLAQADADPPVVTGWLPYDVLAAESLRYAYVRLESDAFSQLWEFCATKKVKVVGDIHTHPKGPTQSPSDKKYPMVSFAGHVALIAPWFAQRSPMPYDVSLNIYLGGGQWESFYRHDAARRIVAP
jgi:hypothetical protein